MKRALALATATGLLAVAGLAAPAAAQEEAPTTSPVKHFVTLMQENHSFDNYFGTYPGADGIPEGVCMPLDREDPDAGCIEPEHLGDRAVQDLAHSTPVFRHQYNDGAMDGFVESHIEDGLQDPRQAMGYYDDRNIPYYWNVADEYVLFDRHFTSAHGGSVSNHMFWVAGTAGGGKGDTIPPEGFDVPTIFDRLEESGVSWKFYIQNYDDSVNLRNRGDGDRAAQVIWAPILNFPRFLDNPDLFEKIVPLEEYFTDLENGTLPAVSYIVPSGASEHPPGSIWAGQAFVRTLLVSLMRSTSWSSSAFFWTYDDWGGWYDHVAPPQVDQHGLGFRAPALLVSPYAKRGHIDSTTLDFTSQLKFIEENWGLQPLTTRDAQANAFWSAFDFDAPPREPVFLSTERDPAPPPEARSRVVYISYGAAVVVFIGVVLFSAAADRRHRRILEAR